MEARIRGAKVESADAAGASSSQLIFGAAGHFSTAELTASNFLGDESTLHLKNLDSIEFLSRFMDERSIKKPATS